MKTASTAAIAASLVASASAFGYNQDRTFATVQFTNNYILQARADPIVSPGKIAGHVHTILGGSNFGLSSTGEDLLKSNCTNANVKGDNSNYWFPLLYFQDPQTGKLEPVEVFYPKVYYFFEKTQDVIKAFPPGLSMLVGDPTKRDPPSSPEEILTTGSGQEISNVHVTCPRDEKVTDDDKYPTGPSWPTDSDGTKAGIGSSGNPGAGVGFPFRNCDGYASPLRMDIHFPSCLKKNADLTDYKNNMAWPKSENGYQNCAEDEIHVPHLFMEVYWNTPLFKDRWDHSGNGPQPFVLASGDRTGYAWHADFMAGWDTDILQNVIDNCNTGNGGMLKCPGVEENKEKCTIETPVDEIIGGVLDQLPGNNPISGWGVGANPAPQPSGSSSSSAVASSTAAGSSTSAAASSSTSASSVASASSSSASAASSSSKAASSGLPGASDDATKVIENPAVSTSSASTSSAVAVETSGAPQSSASSAASQSSTKTKKPKSTCALKTVYETVTVTAPAPGTQSQASHARRHEHEHLHHRHAGHRH
ncbi:unnamed protein product [Clonostachys rosea]|uniref:DUF1996 domain-containing protein n=1 Tax=Bionectria ochroleuca TaxID=29856 RepID=A0ABY6U013_BIOOC|nr:unnamed protein product [Clonostachys rosea]